MWQESGERCIYCGKVIGLTEFLNGIEAEREHILPQAVFFDDSFSNKVCSCRECNHKKGKLTAYDFMKSQGDDVLENYISRVDDLYRDKTISKTKHDRLLTAGDQIPTDFLNRDLSLTQYITKKATDILSRITPKVTTTTGSVTDFLRHQWGYDMILHNLNFERFDKCGQTEEIVIDNHGEKHTEKRIKGWGKRCDHRHHAIDALVVALTRQSHIQRLNNLNAERDEMSKEVTTLNRQWNAKKSLLEKWIAIQPHFDVDVASAAVDRIAISIKPGQRLSTTSKRYVQRGGKRKLVQKGIITPRGALWEETVYGKIRAVDGSEAIVVRYPVESLKCKDLYSVVDDNIRALLQQRAKQCDNDDKTFKQSFAKEPLYTDAAQSCQLRTVRCFTGLDASKLAVVAKSANNNIGFAKAGNNHHIALYTDTKGAIHEIVVPFWLAVERKKYGVSSIIVNPQEELDKIHQSDKDIPEAILNTLPNAEWQMMLTLQQNEMFIIGMSDEEFDSAMQNDNLAELTAHMYRVQKLTNGDYFFRRQTSTSSDTKKTEFENGNVFRIRSLNKIKDYNPIKVKINLIGKIEKV
jgi:CRISPR-associated endonuclease Csn1